MLQINKLTARFVASKGLKPGRVGDGGGLWFRVTPTGARGYTFMYRDRETGRQIELYLGNADDLTLADARDMRLALRKQLREGLDPKTVRLVAKASRKALRGRKTFGQVADLFLASPNVQRFKNAKHKQQWARTLGECVDLRKRYVDEIGTDDIVLALTLSSNARPKPAAGSKGASKRCWVMPACKACASARIRHVGRTTWRRILHHAARRSVGSTLPCLGTTSRPFTPACPTPCQA